MVEEVSDRAEVRQSSSSLLSAAASFRRPALTVMVLGAAAVIVVLARHTLAKSLHVLAAASPGWLLLALAAEAVSLPGYGGVFGLTLANWAFDCVALALSIRAMGQPVPWDDLLLVYGAGAAVASTGLTPGGFALVELAMTAALTASGLHSSAALAAVVAYRFISFWLVLLGGWVAFIVLAHPLRRRRGR